MFYSFLESFSKKHTKNHQHLTNKNKKRNKNKHINPNGPLWIIEFGGKSNQSHHTISQIPLPMNPRLE